MLEEQVPDVPTQGFTGWWIPRSVVELLHGGTLNPRQVILLSLIHGLEQGPGGCFAGNKYLAKAVQANETTVRADLATLRKLGLVFTKHFDGRKRTLGTHLGECREKRQADCSDSGPILIKGNKAMSQQQAAEDSGLGLDVGVSENGKVPTSQDIEHAKALHTITTAKQNTLTPPKFHGSKCKAWGQHFRKLRTLDGVSDERVRAALGWYANHRGEQWVPVANSAEAFRCKFAKIEAAMARTPDLPKEARPAAIAMADRLVPLGWPDDRQIAPIAEWWFRNYAAWRAKWRGLQKKLEMDDLVTVVSAQDRVHYRAAIDKLLTYMPVEWGERHLREMHRMQRCPLEQRPSTTHPKFVKECDKVMQGSARWKSVKELMKYENQEA